MAISVPNVVKVTGSGVTSVTTSGVTTTAGSTFVAWTTADDAVTINAPSDSKSNSYGTAKATVSTGGGTSKQTVYVKENGAGGASHTLTFTFGSSTFPTCFFIECAGADTASYDAGSLASGASGAGSPFNRNSAGQAQAANAILTFCATDAGGTLTYANSGYTVSQESDGNTYWTGAVGYRIVNQTSAVTSSWTVSASNGGTITFAIKEAAAGAATYTPPPRTAQVMSQQPVSMAPMMRFASVAATALAVAAGGYVPTGANAALQAQVAYREPPRSVAVQPVVDIVPQVGAAVPPEPVVQVQQQPWAYAALEAWRAQAKPALQAGIATIYLEPGFVPPVPPTRWPYEQFHPKFQDIVDIAVTGPVAPPQPVNQWLTQPPWPYSALESWRLQPEPAQIGGIAAIYLGAPPVRQVPRADWPYSIGAVPVLEPVAATMPVPGQVPFNALPNLAQQAWGYAQVESVRLAPEPATFGGIAAVNVGPAPVRQPGQVAWPYANATVQSAGPAATIPVAAQVPSSSTPSFWQTPWVHAAIEAWRLQPEAATFAGITPIYLGPSAPAQITSAPWPYVGAAPIQQGPAATIPVAAQIPFCGVAVATTSPWPYLLALPRLAAWQWGISQVYVGAAALAQVQQQAWPHAGVQPRAAAPITLAAQVPYAPLVQGTPPQPWPHAAQQPRIATPLLQAADVPVQQVFQGAPQSAWPYARMQRVNLLGAQPAPVFFGVSPVRQWFTQTPWPYIVTMPAPGIAGQQAIPWVTTAEVWLVEGRSQVWKVAERSVHAVVDARARDAKAQKR